MELTIGTLIKLILGIFVFVVVVAGVYLFYQNYVIDFIKNIPTEGPVNLGLSLLN